MPIEVRHDANPIIAALLSATGTYNRLRKDTKSQERRDQFQVDRAFNQRVGQALGAPFEAAGNTFAQISLAKAMGDVDTGSAVKRYRALQPLQDESAVFDRTGYRPDQLREQGRAAWEGMTPESRAQYGMGDTGELDDDAALGIGLETFRQRQETQETDQRVRVAESREFAQAMAQRGIQRYQAFQNGDIQLPQETISQFRVWDEGYKELAAQSRPPEILRSAQSQIEQKKLQHLSSLNDSDLVPTRKPAMDYNALKQGGQFVPSLPYEMPNGGTLVYDQKTGAPHFYSPPKKDSPVEVIPWKSPQERDAHFDATHRTDKVTGRVTHSFDGKEWKPVKDDEDKRINDLLIEGTKAFTLKGTNQEIILPDPEAVRVWAEQMYDLGLKMQGLRPRFGGQKTPSFSDVYDDFPEAGQGAPPRTQAPPPKTPIVEYAETLAEEIVRRAESEKRGLTPEEAARFMELMQTAEAGL